MMCEYSPVTGAAAWRTDQARSRSGERGSESMHIDRRTMMAGTAALLASASTLGRAAASASWYDKAIIIDALGGTGDPYAPDRQLRYGDRAWAETLGSGVTVVRDTVFPVGNVADPWGDYQKSVADRQNLIYANP